MLLSCLVSAVVNGRWSHSIRAPPVHRPIQSWDSLICQFLRFAPFFLIKNTFNFDSFDWLKTNTQYNWCKCQKHKTCISKWADGFLAWTHSKAAQSSYDPVNWRWSQNQNQNQNPLLFPQWGNLRVLHQQRRHSTPRAKKRAKQHSKKQKQQWAKSKQ